MYIMKYCIPFIVLLTLVSCGNSNTDPGANQAPPPPPVVLMQIERKDLPITYTLPGQLSGVQSVDVIARVEGTLLKQYFSNGKTVRAGESLFLIDPSTYQAQVKEREAQLQGAIAQYTYAKAEYERIRGLFEKDAYSKAQYEQAYSTFQAAESQKISAQQALDIAKINLSYTKVLATVDGIVQKPEYTLGSYVKAGSQLTSIAGVNTLYVNFAIPATRHQHIMDFLAKGLFVLDPAGYTVNITRYDNTQYPIEASVDFIGTNINTTTNSVSWRAILNNTKGDLLPGEFVSTELKGLIAKNAVVIPQKAIISRGSQSFVWIIGENNIAQLRPVILGDTVNKDVIILQGLEQGDRIIVEGILKARPGAPITPIPAGAPQGQTPTNNNASTTNKAQ